MYKMYFVGNMGYKLYVNFFNLKSKYWVFIYFLVLWLYICVWKLDELFLYKKLVNFEFINNCMLF